MQRVVEPCEIVRIAPNELCRNAILSRGFAFGACRKAREEFIVGHDIVDTGEGREAMSIVSTTLIKSVYIYYIGMLDLGEML